jgi:hypothetical protein
MNIANNFYIYIYIYICIKKNVFNAYHADLDVWYTIMSSYLKR